MATLKITNTTLKVIGAPEPHGEWWWCWIKSAFFKTPDDPRKYHIHLYPLKDVKASLIPGSAPLTFEWLVTRGFRSRDFWTLTLVLKNDTTKVITSLDYASIRLAFDQVEAAMNAPDGFLANVTIENSNIVIDSYVGRDVKNSGSSDGTAKAT